MASLPVPPPLASAAVVFFGRYGDVTRLAHQRGVCRQDLYRQAHAAATAVAGTQAQQRLAHAQQRLAQAQGQLDALQQQLRRAVVLHAGRQAEFAATAAALGVSLSTPRALLGVLLGSATPSVSPLGRLAQQAGQKAGAVLAVLDEYARPRAHQVAADEIFTGTRPVLMTLEQHSLCWVGGRLAASRDRDEWAQEFRQLPALAELTRDGGLGMRKGLQRVNAERQQAGREPADDQDDHFHILFRGRRGLRSVRRKAVKAFEKADQAQKALERDRRGGLRISGGRVLAVRRLWQKAEPLWDRWVSQERAFERLRAALRLFTPQRRLNTRAHAEAEVQAALADLTGPEWARLRARLVGPKAFTFLDRAARQLAALPVAPELVQAAVRLEGLRRQPAALRGTGASAAALRGVLLACTAALGLAGQAGVQAQALVGGVLAGLWRSSSLVEGLNSVLRMQQARQKRLTQGLLDLKRLYWNLHTFRAGKRKKQSPYQRLGLVVPPGSWWQLLQMTPEQLRDQLSELNPAA